MLLLNGWVYGQSTADTSSITSMDDIMILASRTFQSATSSVPVQRLFKNQLENINSFSVAEAVKYFSGVFLKDYGGVGGLKTISVRSLGANHTGVMYDGLMLSDVQNGQIDLGKFSLEHVREIILTNAQPSNLLQPARAFSYASVLSIVTTPSQFMLQNRNGISSSFKTGSFGLIKPSVTWEHRIGKRFYNSVHATWEQSTGAYNFTYKNGSVTEKGHRINTGMKALQATYDVLCQVNDSNALSLNLYYYYSKRNLPGAIILYSSPGIQQLLDDNFFAQASWKRNISIKSQLLISGKYNSAYSRYVDTTFLNNEKRLDNLFRQREIYITAAYSYRISQVLHIAYAGDFFHNILRAEFFPIGNQIPKPQRISWLNNISARLQWHQLQLDAALLNSNIFNKVAYGPKPFNAYKYTPSVAIIYKPFEGMPLHIRAFYKNIFRMPSFNDLYYTQSGNTSLRPEFAKQLNIGLTWQQGFKKQFLQMFIITADGYCNHLKDMIVAVPRGNIAQWSMQNIGLASVRGLDISIKFFLKPIGSWQFYLSGNYSLQQALDITDPVSDLYKNQIPYMPKNSGSFNAQMRYKAFSFSYNAVFSDGRYTSGQNSYATFMPAWNTQDITLDYRLKNKRIGNWRFVLELNNLFNEQYQIIQYYPMPGRNIRTGIYYNI